MKTMNKRVVFVVNRSGHDFSDAERFGELVFLSEGNVNKLALTKMYRDMSATLKDSSADDSILLSGPTNLCCIAVACFAYLHDIVNLLLFHDGRYVTRKIVLGELLKKETKSGPPSNN